MRIYPRHLSQMGYCRRGARKFFVRHGLDWSTFVRQGIPAERLALIDDFMVDQLIKVASDELGRQESNDRA